MVNLGIIVLLLATGGREEHLSHAFPAKSSHKLAEVIERAVIENTLNEQGVADIVLLVVGRIPEEIPVLINDLFA